jgi:hypothetical protein
MKTCCECKEQKHFEHFNKDKSRKYGIHAICKSCAKEYKARWYKDNIDKIKLRRKINANKIKEYDKQYYKVNTDIRKQRSKEYAKNNPDKIKEYRKTNAISIAMRNKNYRAKNTTKIRQYKKEYVKKRRKTDTLYKFSENIRSLLINSFKRNKTKNYKKQIKSEQLLCCTIPKLRDHIEKQFQPGMTWGNHGRYGWHIDHVIPLSSAMSQSEIERLCHYTNLQPLWAKDNLEKSDKIIIDTIQ